MSDYTAKSVQTCVIGCGGCGSQIAAYFDKIPSILKHRAWRLYPIRCAAIDTAQGMENILAKSPWYWHEKEDIHIIPTASQDSVYRRITGKGKADSSDSVFKTLQKRWRSGAGQFPFIGTLTAEEYFNEDNEFGKDLQTRLITRQFTEGGLLIVNSLTGGTGTGFAPIIPEFFSNFHRSGIILDLAVIPQVTTSQIREQFYPKNIIYGLYQLSQSKRIDAVILADNEILAQSYNCKSIPQYNSMLHEMMTPILLASSGEYDYPNFCKHIDFSDIYRMLRPNRGMAAAELCALSYASKKLPCSILLWLKTKFFKTKRQEANYVDEWLCKLVDQAIKTTTIGHIDMTKVKSAVGIISGPPRFFHNFLADNAQFYMNLVACANKKISPNLLLGCLMFPDSERVQITFVLSGVGSSKLEELYCEIVPPKEQTTEGTLMERIRRLNSKMVENLMIKEIREKLETENQKDATAVEK